MVQVHVQPWVTVIMASKIPEFDSHFEPDQMVSTDPKIR